MQLLDYNDLRAKGIRLSRVQLWRLVRDKKFPVPLKPSAGKNAWVESEIDEWIKGRIAERDAGSAGSK